MTGDELMADLTDRGVNPDPDGDPRFMLEINEDRTADVEFRESLAFHSGFIRADEAKGFSSARTWEQSTDENGYLTPESEQRLVEGFRRLFATRGVTGVDVSYASGLEFDDEPSVAVTFTSRFSDGETFGEWFSRVGWPIIGNVIDGTDPGTFNCPYVYGEVICGSITPP